MSGRQRFDYLVKLLLIGDSGTCYTAWIAMIFVAKSNKLSAYHAGFGQIGMRLTESDR